MFGSGKKGQLPAPTPQDAIQKLRETEEMLIKKQEFLEKKVEQEIATAKKNGKKNKRLALHALKRKKQYEKQLQQIDGTLSTIEFQREALENASTNAEVLSVMGQSAKALKAAHNHMDVDQVIYDFYICIIWQEHLLGYEILVVYSHAICLCYIQNWIEWLWTFSFEFRIL